MTENLPAKAVLEGEALPPIPKDMDGYELAMHMAGAKIHAFEQFGSYQGDWWALVTYNGETGWIHDYYGSCSGCDAFEGTFGWTAYEDPGYAARLAAFGRDYLDQMMTQEEAEATAGEHSSWDLEAGQVLKFLRENNVAQTEKSVD